MAKLATKSRKKVPAKDFGEPRKRAYPMPDKAHAANAKARAAQMLKKGKLSEVGKEEDRREGKQKARCQEKTVTKKESASVDCKSSSLAWL